MKTKLIIASGTLLVSLITDISVVYGQMYRFNASDLCWYYRYRREQLIGISRDRQTEFYTCEGVGEFSPSAYPIIACSSNGCILIDVVRK